MLVDSNILIYAINADSPKSKLARKFLRENLGNLEIAHQNILETIRVLTHKSFSNPMNLKDVVRAIMITSETSSIISPDQSSYYIALELIENHRLKGNRIFDAYLVATALSNDIKIIATDNEKDFKKFKEIKIVNPFR